MTSFFILFIFFPQTVSKFGSIDILVSNAAVGNPLFGQTHSVSLSLFCWMAVVSEFAHL